MTWAKITHDLARAAGISVPDSELRSGSTTSSSAVAPRVQASQGGAESESTGAVMDGFTSRIDAEQGYDPPHPQRHAGAGSQLLIRVLRASHGRM
jgi:hypothetical protein